MARKELIGMSSRSMRIGWSGLIVMVAVCGARAADAPPPSDAAPGLAWRLDAISSAQLGPDQPDAAWKRSAALLEAAGRLSPAEPRFPRLGAMARLHLDDVDGAITAVRAYRQIVPADKRAQAQLIDLYTSPFRNVCNKKVSGFVQYPLGLFSFQDVKKGS